jgi:hypothetical protein
MLERSKQMHEILIIKLQKMGYTLGEAEKIASTAEQARKERRWKLINSIVNIGFLVVTIGWIALLAQN